MIRKKNVTIQYWSLLCAHIFAFTEGKKNLTGKELVTSHHIKSIQILQTFLCVKLTKQIHLFSKRKVLKPSIYVLAGCMKSD